MRRFIAFHAYQFLLLTICVALLFIAIPCAIVLSGELELLFLVLLGGPFIAFFVARRLARPMRARLRPKETPADNVATMFSVLAAFLLVIIATEGPLWWRARQSRPNECRRFNEEGPPVDSVSFSPDGNYFASADGGRNSVSIWDVHTTKKLRSFEASGAVSWAAYSPDGKYLLGLTARGAVNTWDIKTGKPLATITSSESRITSACWCADSQSILSGEMDGTVRQWHCGTGQELRRFKGQASTTGRSSVACSPDGQRVLYGGKLLILWDLKTGRELRRFNEVGRQFYAVTFSSDSKLIACADGCLVRVLDVASGKTLVQQPLLWHAFAFHPDGRKLLAGNDGIYVCDIATGRALGQIYPAGPGRIQSLAVSPDGRFILAASEEQSDILLWQMPHNPDSKLEARGSP